MKYILAIIAVIFFTVGPTYAGCGKKLTSSGKLKSFNADGKQIVLLSGKGKEVRLTLTPITKTSAKGGKKTSLKDLIGKNVTVISEHKKVDSVTGT